MLRAQLAFSRLAQRERQLLYLHPLLVLGEVEDGALTGRLSDPCGQGQRHGDSAGRLAQSVFGLNKFIINPFAGCVPGNRPEIWTGGSIFKVVKGRHEEGAHTVAACRIRSDAVLPFEALSLKGGTCLGWVVDLRKATTRQSHIWQPALPKHSAGSDWEDQ